MYLIRLDDDHQTTLIMYVGAINKERVNRHSTQHKCVAYPSSRGFTIPFTYTIWTSLSKNCN